MDRLSHAAFNWVNEATGSPRLDLPGGRRNRGSVVIGSVAFYLDRYGYDILPLAVRRLRGEVVPPRTATRHILITPANVFAEYPPYDMN